MESLEPHGFLEFNENQLQDVRKVYNYDIRKLNQAINLFEEWIAKQNHFRVRKFDRKYLERYIISNKGSIERAKTHFDNLCTYRKLMPEFFQNIDVRNEFRPLRACCKVGIISKPLPDNYRVLISLIHDNHEDMDFVKYFRYAVTVTEYILHHDYSVGWVVIFDTREMPYSLLLKMNPIVFTKAFKLVVETMGQRIKSMHFLSGSKFLDTVVALFKQSLSEKLAKRIQIHDTIESLHNFTEKDTLPPEYGGKGKTMQQLDDEIFKAVSTDEHIARLKFLESTSTDESCRLSSKFNEEYSSTPGSFKSMVID